MRQHFASALRVIALWVVLGGLWVAQAAPLSAEVRVSAEAARDLAARLISEGRPAEALVLTEGLLSGVPDDIPALLLKSRALRDMGRNAAALAAADEAWKSAGDNRDKFFAAMAMAQARSSDGRRGIAQYWLRRAAQIAPDDQLKSVAVRDFRHVRRITPWRVSLSFSAAPSSNLNGAPKSNKVILGGLQFVNPTAVPLSGVRLKTGAQLRYTLPVTARSRINLELSGLVERVQLSSDAQRKVPTARSSDYKRESLETLLVYEKLGPDAAWLGRASIGFGRDWLAGDAFADTTKLAFSYGRAIAPGYELGGSIGYDIQTRHDLRLRSSRRLSYGVTAAHVLQNGARLKLDLTLENTTSDSAIVANEARGAVLSYALAQPVVGVLPRLSVSFEQTDFARPLYGNDPRSDGEWGLSLDVLLPKLAYFGFAPEIGVTFSERDSNYSIFDSRSTDLRLGLRSVF